MPRYKKIYEDKWLLVIDKPAGLLTVPAHSKFEVSLLDLLSQEYRDEEVELFPCHRLDKETSGLVIFAKDKLTQEEIMGLFRKKEIKKEYIAIVHGWIERNPGEIRNYLRENHSSTSREKLAITRYHVLQKNTEYSIVKIEPLTGRKNQIRIHFKQLGHPIVGERRFAFAKDYSLQAKRLCLHATQLEFIHPRTKNNLILTSPIPSDMEEFF